MRTQSAKLSDPNTIALVPRLDQQARYFAADSDADAIDRASVERHPAPPGSVLALGPVLDHRNPIPKSNSPHWSQFLISLQLATALRHNRCTFSHKTDS